jgi:hypothetical protein
LFFLIMGIRMNARVSQLDDTVLAVGKRAVELNVAMGTMDGLQGTLIALRAGQEGFDASLIAMWIRFSGEA